MNKIKSCILKNLANPVKAFLRLAAAFEDLVEVGEVAVIVAIEFATLAPDATGTPFLPLVIKHSFSNALQCILFVYLSFIRLIARPIEFWSMFHYGSAL